MICIFFVMEIGCVYSMFLRNIKKKKECPGSFTFNIVICKEKKKRNTYANNEQHRTKNELK